jgi:hypothetical protein
VKVAGEKGRALDRIHSARARCEQLEDNVLRRLEREEADEWRAARNELLAACEALERACRVT